MHNINVQSLTSAAAMADHLAETMFLLLQFAPDALEGPHIASWSRNQFELWEAFKKEAEAQEKETP